jgi:hypothetical protein
MTIKQIIKSAKAVTDTDGNQVIQLDWPAWEELLTLLEDLEDSEELARLREAVDDGDEEVIPWSRAKAELKAEGVNV